MIRRALLLACPIAFLAVGACRQDHSASNHEATIDGHRSQVAFQLPERDLVPEGICYDPVSESFGAVYPEIPENRGHIMTVISEEEKAFQKTVKRGSSLLAQHVASLKQSKASTLRGEDVFDLANIGELLIGPVKLNADKLKLLNNRVS